MQKNLFLKSPFMVCGKWYGRFIIYINLANPATETHISTIIIAIVVSCY